jgi:hypothetical protein
MQLRVLKASLDEEIARISSKRTSTSALARSCSRLEGDEEVLKGID